MARNVTCKVDLETMQKVLDSLNSTTRDQLGLDVDAMALITKSIGDGKGANNFIYKSKLMKAEGLMFELFVNNLVGGVSTMGINLMANTYMTGHMFMKQVGAIGGAGLRADGKGMAIQTRIAINQFTSMISSTSQALNMGFSIGKGWDSLDLPLERFGIDDVAINSNAGGPTTGRLDPDLMTARQKGRGRQAWSSDYVGLDSQSVGGKAMNAAGFIVNVPGNVLRHSDLYFKSVNYNAKMIELARHRAEELRVRDNLSDRATEDMYQSLVSGSDVEMVKEAAETANRNTFTNQLSPKLQDFRTVLQAPGLRMVTPFYKTLMNLTSTGLQESILGEAYRMMLGKDYWNTIIAKGPKGDAARSQLMVGIGTATAIQMSMGPDLERDGYGWTYINDRTEESGRLGDNLIAESLTYTTKDGTSINFSEMEPLATMLKLQLGTAKMFERVQILNPDGSDTMGRAEMLAAASYAPIQYMFSSQIGVQTITKLSDILSVMTSDDPDAGAKTISALEDFAVNLATPKYLTTISKMVDEPHRRAFTFMEKLKKGWPGVDPELGVVTTLWGDKLEPKLGVPVDAMARVFTEGRDPDEIDFFIRDNNVQFIDNPRQLVAPKSSKRVDLNTLQSQEYMELSGQAIDLKRNDSTGQKKLKLPALKDILKAKMSTDTFKGYDEFTKKDKVQQWISMRQQAAAHVLISRHKGLQDQVASQRQKEHDIKTGKISAFVELDFDFLESVVDELMAPN